MSEYLDGLSRAAVNVSKLQVPAGAVASYYISAAIMLISSLLSIMLPEKSFLKKQTDPNDY